MRNIVITAYCKGNGFNLRVKRPGFPAHLIDCKRNFHAQNQYNEAKKKLRRIKTPTFAKKTANSIMKVASGIMAGKANLIYFGLGRAICNGEQVKHNYAVIHQTNIHEIIIDIWIDGELRRFNAATPTPMLPTTIETGDPQ